MEGLGPTTPGPHAGAMSIDQFTEFAGICRSLVYAEIKSGRLKARRIASRRTIITYEDAQEFLRSLSVIDLKPAA